MIGEIKAYGGSSIPKNHLECDGSAVSRSLYAELFAVIGTSYGSGDGSTTFNLPNLKGRMLVGYSSGDADFNAVGKTGGADSQNLQHTHTQTDHTHQISGTTNTSNSPQGSGSGKTTAHSNHNHPFGPFTSSGASNLGMTNQLSTAQSVINPYITVKFIIQAKTKRSRAFLFFATVH